MPDESLEPDPAPVAAAPAGPKMSEEEAMAKAKTHYVAAETLAKDGKWTAALPLYEQAYQLVPGKHGFALKVAQAAEQSGDCTKAITYYEHYVTYASEEKYAEKRAEAQTSVDTLREGGCE